MRTILDTDEASWPFRPLELKDHRESGLEGGFWHVRGGSVATAAWSTATATPSLPCMVLITATTQCLERSVRMIGAEVKMYLPARTAQVLVRDSLLSGGVKIWMDATFLVSYGLASPDGGRKFGCVLGPFRMRRGWRGGHEDLARGLEGGHEGPKQLHIYI